MTRRSALALAGSVGAGALIGCDDAGGAGADAGTNESDAAASDVVAADSSICTLYPEQVEGPYYVPGDLVRQDITEGRPGTPLTLRLRIVGQGACVPLAGVAVDVWHCDALGVYSGFPSQVGGLDTRGQTFLRGTQASDANGEVEFTTIYPGWYPGRTTHIHFKVRPTATSEAVAQLYFPEALSQQVYAQLPPYNSRGPKDTSNAGDGTNRLGIPQMPLVESKGDGFVARYVVAIAKPAGDKP